MKKSRGCMVIAMALAFSAMSGCASQKMNAEIDARMSMNEDAIRAVALDVEEAKTLSLEAKSDAALARIEAQRATEKAFRMLQHSSMK